MSQLDGTVVEHLTDDKPTTTISFLSPASWTYVSSVEGFSFNGVQVLASANDLQSLLREIRRLKIKEIPHDLLEDFQPIGRGETFTVSECRFKDKVVAVKHVNLGDADDWSDPKVSTRRLRSVLREVSIMCHETLASHPNIVSLLGFGWQTKSGCPYPYTVVENGEFGSLRSFLKATPNWPIGDKLIHAGDVASGLMALHHHDIVHGDLKLDNVILFYAWGRSSGGIAKLCDFGHSLIVTANNANPQKYYGTLRYTPPEVDLQSQIPIEQSKLHKCDIWTFGLLVWEILAGGAEYFNTSWRDDARYALPPMKLESSLRPGRLDHLGDLATGDLPENHFAEEIRLVFGSFDRRCLKDRALEFLDVIYPHGGWMKGWLKPLFKLTLAPNPSGRLSDLSRLPLGSCYWMNSARETSLQVRLALHTGNSELHFDLLRPDRGYHVMWEHQTQILQSLQAVVDEGKPGPRHAAAIFQIGLCLINGFGCTVNHPEADLLLRQAVEQENWTAIFLEPRLANSLRPRSEIIPSWQSVMATGFRTLIEPTSNAAMTSLDLTTNKDDVTDTLLIQACWYGSAGTILALLELGANPNIPTAGNCNILHWLFCLDEGQPRTSQVFQEIFLNAKHAKHLSAMMGAMCRKTYSLGPQWPLELSGTPLAFAVMTGSETAVRYLLAAGANPRENALPLDPKSGENAPFWSAMHLAVKYNFPSILSLLCDRARSLVQDDRSGGFIFPGSSIRVAYGRAVRNEALDFPTFPLGSALSYLTPVERRFVHGGAHQQVLQRTIECLPGDVLGWQAINGLTPLLQAIDFQDYEVVSAILKLRPALAWRPVYDPRQTKKSATTSAKKIFDPHQHQWPLDGPTADVIESEDNPFNLPLHFSAEICSRHDNDDALRIPRLLLKHLPSGVNAVDSERRTPLHIAVRANFARTTTFLIQRGAKIDFQDIDGQTPLLVAQSPANISVLLANHASKDHRDKEGRSAIHHACIRGSESCLEALIKGGCRIDLYSIQHGSPLHCALSRKSAPCVDILLKSGANIDIRGKNGDTTLHLALMTAKLDLVKLILARDPELSLCDSKGRTALTCAMIAQSQRIFEAVFLHQLERFPPKDFVIILFECAESGTPLALQFIVQHLSSHGIDVNLCNDKLCTPLHCAAEAGRADNLTVLLAHGAEVDRLDLQGMTPLMKACTISENSTFGSRSNSALCCKKLSDAGANIFKADFHNRTAWKLSRERQNFDTMASLMSSCKSAELLDEMMGETPVDLPLIEAANLSHSHDFITACLKYCVSTSTNLTRGNIGSLEMKQQWLNFLRPKQSEGY